MRVDKHMINNEEGFMEGRRYVAIQFNGMFSEGSRSVKKDPESREDTVAKKYSNHSRVERHLQHTLPHKGWRCMGREN